MARHAGTRAEGKALLETDEVLFRSPRLRLRIPRKDVSKVAAADGVLTLAYPGGELALELGAQAEKWAHELLHPKSRADKLGVKPGQRAWLAGVTDAALGEELAARGVETLAGRRPKDVDLAFVQVDEPASLGEAVADAAQAIAKDGALWLVTPRGVDGLKDVDVMAAAKKAGLVDVKVVRFNETHTALRLVVPKAKR